MFATNHTLTGTALAVAIDNPAILAPVAFSSHFVLDVMPHFGKHPKLEPESKNFNIMLVIDLAIALFVTIASVLVYPARWFNILLAIFLALSPDLISGIKWVFKKKYFPGFQKFHSAIQWAEQPYGMPVEFIYAFLFVFVLFG